MGGPRTERPQLVLVDHTTDPPIPRRQRRSAAASVQGRIEGLDGVRAVAVVAVIVYHLWPARLPGGFLGVDVFFVISGFLITTLLLRERTRTGRIDLAGFWLRRARRLLPALVVVVVACIVAAALVDRDLLVGIDRQVLGAATFSTNWVEIGHGADYFDATSPTLFLTFWSLAVEEQFYVVWPVALLGFLAVARSARPRVWLALLLATVSAVLMAVWFTPGSNPTRVYYGTDTHLAGLMIGVALALAFSGEVGMVAQPRWIVLRRWTGFVALAGIGLLFWRVESAGTFTYRGGIVLASVLTAVVVACLPGPPSTFTRVARFAPLTWIGERSYGLYLWHWPVILIVAELLPASEPGSEPTLVGAALSIGLTLLLTEVSYRWVEMPVRERGFREALRAVPARPALLGAAGVVLVAAGALVATAPDKSGAQLQVERGQQEIAEQAAVFERGGPIASPPDGSTTPVTAGSTTTTPGAPTTAPPGAWPADQALPAGDQIVGFGDSVLSGAAPAVYDRFPGVLLDAKPIRQWREAPGLVERADAAGALRPVVVLNFGTNAGLQSDESKTALRQVLDALGPTRRVVLVNTVGVSRWVPQTNADLAAISAEYPNTKVMDWHATVEADPGLLHADRTHPNVEGIAVYADQLAATIDDLGPG